MKKGYKHFSIYEREKILFFLGEKLSLRAMGKKLGRSHTSISDEIKRNSVNGEYSPHIAENLYKQRRSLTGSKYKLLHDTELKEYIELKIKKDDWLPDEVAGRSKLEGYQTISTSTIYRGIAKGLLDIDEKQHLKFKGKRKAKNSKDQRGTIPDRKFIEERPLESWFRIEIGHWEGDLVISKGRKGGLLTLVDRLSRYSLVEKVEDKSSKSIIEAFNRMKKKIPAEYLKTITVDNGKEFAGFKEIEKNLNVDVYFCNPYSPWEKGSNENFNGVLRQTYPKGTVFSEIPDEELERTIERIRNRPRKVLNYFTANEVFFENMWWCA